MKTMLEPALGVLDAARPVLEARLPAAVRLLRDLVAIPSLRGGESRIQEEIARVLSSRGLLVSRVYVDPRRHGQLPGFSSSSTSYDGSPNVVGTLPGIGGGRSLALNFHVDTAPPGPRELWHTDPYGAEFRDGKVFGRGSWDDKAGCALAVLVLDTIRELELHFRGDLLIQSVIEDETTGNGTLALVAEGHTADAGVILDGGYGPTAILGHPGHLNFRLTVYGRPAPSCRSDLGENAIEKMFLLVRRLHALKSKLSASIPEEWARLGHPVNLNVGVIQGGSWTGSVPEKCRLDCQISFLPPHKLQSIKDQLIVEIEEAAREDSWLAENLPLVEFVDLATDPVRLPARNEFFSLLGSGCQQFFDKPLTPRLVTGWCDLRHFNLLKPTPCCMFGPGKGANAHRPDEYFVVAELVPHALVILHQLVAWCGLG